MSRFYGTVQGHRGPATRGGHKRIKTSAQSYDGSVITELFYNEQDELMVQIMAKKGESTTYGETLFYGTLDDYIEKLR